MLARFKLSAKESRMTDADVVKMLRAEMAKQQHGGGAARPALGSGKAPAHAGAPVRRINPAEVISLDDDDFGKF
jgi:Xaa-Pro aminopeptidase